MGHIGADRTGLEVLEQIPALILIVMATGIFLSTALHAYVDYGASKGDIHMQEESASFLALVQGWDRLTVDGGDSISLSALLSTTDANITTDFDPDTIGFDYQVAFIDKSGYGDGTVKCLGSSEPPLREAVFASWGSTIVVDSNGNNRPYQVVVYVWKGG